MRTRFDGSACGVYICARWRSTGATMPKRASRREAREGPDIAAFREALRKNMLGPWHFVGLLGLKPEDPMKLTERVQKGFTFRALERFQKNSTFSTNDLIYFIQITLRTYNRRKGERRLRSDESDRLLRAARIFGSALALFEGDVEGARDWLLSEQLGLGMQRPIEVSTTEIGAREVENLIGQIEEGIPV